MNYPPLVQNMKVPNIAVQTDSGEELMLAEIFAKNSNSTMTLFIPGFIQCHGICPTLAKMYQSLLSQIPNKQISVIFFSFNSEDTKEDLQNFRNMHSLSSQWQVIRANVSDTQKMLDSLKFVTMKKGTQYDHPAQAFVLSKDMVWLGSLFGADVKVSDVEKMLETAEIYSTSPHLSYVLAFIKNPNTLAVYGFMGLIVSMLVVCIFAIKLKSSPKKARIPKSS